MEYDHIMQTVCFFEDYLKKKIIIKKYSLLQLHQYDKKKIRGNKKKRENLRKFKKCFDRYS